MIHDNAGMVERITAAGFTVEAPVEHRAAHGPDHDRPRASWRPVNLVLT